MTQPQDSPPEPSPDHDPELENDINSLNVSHSTSVTSSPAKTALSSNTNQSPTGYKMRKGKMVGIKIKKSDDIILFHNKYSQQFPTVNIEYLNACQQPKRVDILPTDQFSRFNKYISVIARNKRTGKKSKPKLKENKIRFRISGSVWEYNCVKNSLLNAGLYRTKTSNWNILWSKHLSIAELERLHPSQKANHFPGSSILGRKDRLATLMNKLAMRHGLDVK